MFLINSSNCLRMEEFLLKAKHYQIFLSIFSTAIFLAFIPNFDASIPLIKKIFTVLPFIVWIFMLGKSLNLCIPVRQRLSETILNINLFFFYIVFVFITMLSDITVTFRGWALLIPLYMIFSFIYLFYFASKALTTAEQGRRTSFGNHIGEMILLLIGFLGIWSLQPRINELWEKNKYKFEEKEDENESSAVI